MEFTLSALPDKSAIIWNHIYPGEGGSMTGRKLPNSICKVTRVNNRTHYYALIPLKEIRLTGATNETFKLACLVNDNDANRRLRYMEWFGGIQPTKNTALFAKAAWLEN